MSNIITALDFDNAAEALAFAENVDPTLSKMKVGKELFTRAGPQVVRDLIAMGFDVFLDLKFHDIPNTVAGAVRAANELGVWMLNVHASGGCPMMDAAVAANQEAGGKSLIIAVTVLTSMTDEDVAAVGYSKNAAQQAEHLATLAALSGMDGVVCSPHEAALIKSAVKPVMESKMAQPNIDFVTVTPGVRPSVLNTVDDQRRTMTPVDAIKNGSDYLVIGRPITQASNPNDALTSILNDIRTAV